MYIYVELIHTIGREEMSACGKYEKYTITSLYLSISISLYIYTYIHTYICVCVYIYIHTYIYVYLYTRGAHPYRWQRGSERLRIKG